jgi:hypothetical protein
MFGNNPAITKLKRDNENAAKRIRQLTTLTARSEYTGGTQGYDYADLPSPNKAGMMAYCNDGRKSGEAVGTGTGVLAVVTLLGGALQWVRCDDLNAPVQV